MNLQDTAAVLRQRSPKSTFRTSRIGGLAIGSHGRVLVSDHHRGDENALQVEKCKYQTILCGSENLRVIVNIREVLEGVRPLYCTSARGDLDTTGSRSAAVWGGQGVDTVRLLSRIL